MKTVGGMTVAKLFRDVSCGTIVKLLIVGVRVTPLFTIPHQSLSNGSDRSGTGNDLVGESRNGSDRSGTGNDLVGESRM